MGKEVEFFDATVTKDPKRSEAAKAAAAKRKEKAEKKAKKEAKKAAGEKKPLTGFMLFASEERPKLKAKNPEMTFGETGKALGAAWKALSDAEQAKYKKGKK
jgi:hypothetical protein